jgi:hypothetical protein
VPGVSWTVPGETAGELGETVDGTGGFGMDMGGDRLTAGVATARLSTSNDLFFWQTMFGERTWMRPWVKASTLDGTGSDFLLSIWRRFWNQICRH